MRTKNLLAIKKTQLEQYELSFNNAVQVVQDAVSQLENLETEISDSIPEIEAYQRGLQEIKESMITKKEKNARVRANFKALLGEENENE